MALSDNSQVQAVINSNALKALGVVLTLIAAPFVVAGEIWTVSTLANVDERLGKLETAVNLQLPNIYPRGEATAQFGQVNSRIDGVVVDVANNTHRIGALEDVRQRGLH